MEDCTCPICLCILIEPVTMPCKHSICLPCYKQTVEKANLCCPLCRLRISVWARKSAKANTLIDKVKWDAIKKAFPTQVQKRQEGKEMLDDDDDYDSYETRLRQLMALSKPGEIREEYEAELQKLQHRRQEEAKMEEEASAALIRSLQQEEENENKTLEILKEVRDRLDREIAEKLQETFVSEDDDDKLVELETWNTSLTVSDKGNKPVNKKAVSKINKGKSKQVKQASNNNLTLATFFSPVPRQAGVTSHGSGNMAPRKLDMGSCGDADLSSYVFLRDSVSCEDASHIPASRAEGFVSYNLKSPGHKHSSGSLSVQTAAVNASLDDHAAGAACRANLKLETWDKFAAGPSGLGKCGIVISTAFPDLRTHPPANAAHEIPDNKRSHTRPQLQPIEICSRVSSTQSSSYLASDPPNRPVAAGDDESTGINTSHSGLAFSKSGSLETPFSSSDNETADSCGLKFQTHQAQTPDEGDRCCSSIQNASVLSHRKNFGKFNKVFVESSRSSEDAELESQQTLLADPEHIDCSSEGETRTTSDNVRLPVNPASICSHTNKHDDQLTECRDAAEDADKVNDMAPADNVCGDINDSASINSCHNSTTKSDSDTCTDISEDPFACSLQSVYLASLDKHSNTCNVDSKCNSEKENRIGIDCKQFKDVKINYKKEDSHHLLNPVVKVFKVKTNSVKTSKNSTGSSVIGKKTEPFVSILRWCVPNGYHGEPENGPQTKNNTVIDKTEPVHGKSESVLDYSGKRKHIVSSTDEEKEISDDGKEISNMYSDNRKEMIAKQNDMCFSKKKKKLKNDLAINSSASARQEDSAVDVFNIDHDVDESGMSQEELDYLMAVRLQEMYSRLDKNKIAVDRFKGSKDHYMLRKKTRKK